MPFQPEQSIDISQEMQLLHTKMQERGLKSTPQRDELAAWIFRVHEHFTVDDVIESFRQAGKKVSSATVYRFIQMMLELNLVLEHDFGTGQKHYEHTPGHAHHDHIICRDCNNIIEFSDDDLEKLKDKIAAKHGIKMTSHSLQLFGTCEKPDCERKPRV